MILQGTNRIHVTESQMLFTAEETTSAITLKGGVRVRLQEKGSATRIPASTFIAVNIGPISRMLLYYIITFPCIRCPDKSDQFGYMEKDLTKDRI
jgi:hypothetical protein